MALPAPQAAAILYNLIDHMKSNDKCSVADIKDFIEGGLEQHLRENACDPLLGGDVDDKHSVLVLDGVKYNDVMELANIMDRLRWKETKLEPWKDLDDFLALPEDEKRVVKFVLGFFAIADQLVNRNVEAIFAQRLVRHEFQAFLAQQIPNEIVHKLAYNMLLRTFVTDPDEEQLLLHAYKTIPAIQGLVQWIDRWMSDPCVKFSDQVVAQIAFEAIFFTAAFAVIFRLQSKNLLGQTVLANQWIRRDETVHALFYIAVWMHMKQAACEARVHEIFHSAYKAMESFVDEMLPGAGLPGLDTTLMNQHVKSTINLWLVDKMKLTPLYMDQHGAAIETPLSYTNLNDVPDMVNFFERFNTSYQTEAYGEDIVEW